jgi:glycosyltransferase involved in cell wall biosynthesis
MLPWTASASRRAARRAKAAGDWEGAARHYRQAVERDPRSAATWVQYGNALRECGKPSEAEAAYRRSIALCDADPDAYVQFGHLLKQQRRGDEAISQYLRAVELDPRLLDASRGLIELGWTNHVKPPVSLGSRSSVEDDGQNAGLDRPNDPVLVIDAGDLLLHFLRARLPTGIQRVQLQIIVGLLGGQPRNCELVLACFAPCRDLWVDIPEPLFMTLASLAASGGATDERPWQEAVLELTGILVHGQAVEFPAGAVLVNLGASWIHPNYFLRLRNAKARSGIRFLPFVHDCVPALMPQFCVEGTVRDYSDWLLGVFFHADGYLVNSKSTAADLSRIAGLLGHRILSPQVVRLDGGFSPVVPVSSGKVRPCRTLEPFVLFVSTFEPRKNHLLAFKAWLELIERRGLRYTPRLVCVGQRGWKDEAAISLLRSNKALQRRVRILSGIGDPELTELYRQCLFTLYPSIYEGWGLPVTESLCHGKVPLLSAVAALPEAGGDFAEYFELNNFEDLVRKLERLIDEDNYRVSREARIHAEFRPRSWSAIAGQIVEYAVSKQTRCRGGGDRWAPRAEIGRCYAIARGRENGIREGMTAGEMFRIGEGWWAPEEWGCWLRGPSADLVFSLPDFGRRWRLKLGLRGLPCRPTNFQLTALANGSMRRGILKPDQRLWATLPIESMPSGIVHLRIASDESCSLADSSGELDRRVVTLGITDFQLTADEP